MSGPVGASNLFVRAITDGQDLLVDYTDNKGHQKMFLDQGGQIVPIAVPLSGVKNTLGEDLAHNGNITGTYTDSAPQPHAFLLDGHGGIHSIDIPGAISTNPDRMSPDGKIVVGWYNTNTGFNAYISKNGVITTLNFPGGQTQTTKAYAVNNLGDVVGNYLDNGDEVRAFAYHQGKYYAIPVPGTGTSSATAVNASGQIVGYYALSHCHNGSPCPHFGFVATPTN